MLIRLTRIWHFDYSLNRNRVRYGSNEVDVLTASSGVKHLKKNIIAWVDKLKLDVYLGPILREPYFKLIDVGRELQNLGTQENEGIADP